MSWIIGLSDNQHVFNLYLYKTVKTMWEYLEKVCNQMIQLQDFNWSVKWQITLREACLIYGQNFPLLFVLTIWKYSLFEVLSVNEVSKCDKFFMKLLPDFDIRFNLMSCHLPPTLDVCIGEMFHEDHCLLTQATTEQEKLITSPTTFQAQKVI